MTIISIIIIFISVIEGAIINTTKCLIIIVLLLSQLLLLVCIPPSVPLSRPLLVKLEALRRPCPVSRVRCLDLGSTCRSSRFERAQAFALEKPARPGRPPAFFCLSFQPVVGRESVRDGNGEGWYPVFFRRRHVSGFSGHAPPRLKYFVRSLSLSPTTKRDQQMTLQRGRQSAAKLL